MFPKAYDLMRIACPYWLRKWFKNRSWFTPVTRALFGADVYSASYYKDTERLENVSVEHMGDWIVANLRPASIVDIGCGPGHLMLALKKRGVRVFGVDLAEAAMRRCRDHGVEAQQLDLTRPDAVIPGGPYDLAISCEVAEHMDANFAPRFVDHLIRCSKVIYLTAAEHDPEIGPGLHHVNEQPNTYWIALLAARGYVLDRAATDSARAYMRDHGVIRYLTRPMIFRG